MVVVLGPAVATAVVPPEVTDGAQEKVAPLAGPPLAVRVTAVPGVHVSVALAEIDMAAR